ncbi:hypothetical protein ACWOA4_09395 [Pediococcus pentosaceus]|uniref:hypothetical protein n=1 Tax=Pediococcus pentosaceus TaxID=1255 RepID=UPI001F4550A2|nr:hypothetical protein [Pediococcus pentosaceus]
MSSIGQGSISIDDSTRIGENAQDTANKVAGNVNDINSDNKLTPTEKLKLKQEYDKDVELYNIDIEQLKSVDLPTAELETAMSNLTDFVTPLFKEMNRTSTVDRNALDSVFTAFATADKNSSQAFVNMVQQVADGAKKAGDDAKEVGEKAQEAGEEAKASADQAKVDATQAKADAATAQQKAQSSINQLNEASTKFDGEITNVKKSAQQALDNITVVDSKVDKLSTSTTAQFNTLKNGYQEVISTVNNMDIGGRNIVLDSSNMGSFRIWQADGNSKLSDDKKEITITTSHGGINIENKNLSEYLPNKGDTIVISADVKGNSHLQFNYNDGNNFVGSGTSIAVTTEYKRYFTTFEWNPVNLDRTEFVIYAAGGAEQYLTVKNVKVEIGNKGTDWSPAPEDFASQTQITTLNNLINQKVSNDQYQSDKTQTANLISQTVTNAVSNISVGGRNFIKDSSSDVVIDDTVNKQGWAHSAIYSELEAGQEYTFTSSVTVNAGKANNICINVYNPNTGETTLVSNRPIVNGKIEYTFTAVKDFPVLLAYAGTMGGTKGNKVTFHHYQLERGNKATDWAPAPEDLATSTEIDQLNNAIKLKANSSDITSQINVATKGIQSEVNNKVTDLNTKISQTDSAWRASVSTLGTTNMVYNGGFAHGVDGWNTENGKWTWSNQAQDQVQGNNAIQARFTGLTTDTWNNAASRPFLVRPGQKMSIGAIVTPWVLDSDPKKGFGLGLEFFASKDGTGARNSYHPEQWVFTTGRQQLKVENITVPEGVNSAVVRLFIQRNGGANFTCVQANMTPTLPQFIDGFATATDITASINNINLKVSNANGTSSQININNDTILLDANKIVFSGKTSLLDASIDTAKIANAAINTAQIADGAINNAKIANASIDDAKINSLNGNKLVENSITANKINVNDLIANGINTKTLTAVNLNASTLTTPQLDLGFNGTFTEDFDYTQGTSMFLPKKNKGTLTFNHGVLQSKGNMQTYVNGQWGGMNDSLVFQSGIDNAQWTEVAPGYLKMDLYKQDGTTVAQRTYSDPTGFYYTSTLGDKSYLGNVLQTAQVQTASVLTKYIGPSDGQLRLQIGNNGSHYGFQVGSYAGSEAVLSDFIYSSTSSHSPDIHITEGGHLVRTTSASKYKYNIKNPNIETTLGDRLLNVHLATWNDKRAVDSYAEQLSTGEEREKSSIDEYYGLIAEQLRDAGLDMFISYGKNHEIEGIQYDRAWVPLLSVIRRLNDKVNEYELRLSKLEGASK